MDGLEPYSSFKKGAQCSGDGDEPIDCTEFVPITTISGNKKEGGSSNNENLQILVANDADGKIMYIKANNGKNVEVLQGISNTNILTYITDDGIDSEWTSKFRTEAEEVNADSDRNRHLRSGISADDMTAKHPK